MNTSTSHSGSGSSSFSHSGNHRLAVAAAAAAASSSKGKSSSSAGPGAPPQPASEVHYADLNYTVDLSNQVFNQASADLIRNISGISVNGNDLDSSGLADLINQGLKQLLTTPRVITFSATYFHAVTGDVYGRWQGPNAVLHDPPGPSDSVSIELSGEIKGFGLTVTPSASIAYNVSGARFTAGQGSRDGFYGDKVNITADLSCTVTLSISFDLKLVVAKAGHEFTGRASTSLGTVSQDVTKGDRTTY